MNGLFIYAFVLATALFIAPDEIYDASSTYFILVVGAITVLRRAQENPGKYPWLTQLLARRPFKVVAVALAINMARMAWALLAHGGTSIGKPVFGSCEERTRESVWHRSANHIRASGQTAALKGRRHDRTRTLR